MDFKLIVLACLLAYASASPRTRGKEQVVSTPVSSISRTIYITKEAGPIKRSSIKKKKLRVGESIHGILSQYQPDGSRRIVKYSSDGENGFKAVVYHKPNPLAVKKDSSIVSEPVSAK